MGKVSSVLGKIFLVIMAIITLFPFVYMILSSLMTYQEATSIPPTLFPKSFQWQNFREAMKQAPFARYFVNTVFVAGVSTLGTLVTSVLAAFALVKLEFRFKNVLTAGLATLLMIPYEVTVFTKLSALKLKPTGLSVSVISDSSIPSGLNDLSYHTIPIFE